MIRTLEAGPFPLDFDVASTALIIIDMQRDFVLPGGFGEMLGNDTSLLLAAVEPIQRVLAAARESDMLVIHTREGHRPDLRDCPPAKLTRGGKTFIGAEGPMGRILVRGEQGHDIIPQLYPIAGEPVIDKPGKGSFHATDLQQILLRHGIKTLAVCGVTLEVCVHTTVREANDRGYECVVLSDCVASYFPEFHRVGLEMIQAQGGIFGWVSTSQAFVDALAAPASPAAGPAPGTDGVLLAVNGTLMRGLKLNPNMLAAGATFVREAATEPAYRIWTVNDDHPAMVRMTDGSGVKVALEIWSVPPEGLAGILQKEPPGLSIGKVKLDDGETVLGVLGEPALVEGQREITGYGGWRAYVAAEKVPS